MSKENDIFELTAFINKKQSVIEKANIFINNEVLKYCRNKDNSLFDRVRILFTYGQNISERLEILKMIGLLEFCGLFFYDMLRISKIVPFEDIINYLINYNLPDYSLSLIEVLKWEDDKIIAQNNNLKFIYTVKDLKNILEIITESGYIGVKYNGV